MILPSIVTSPGGEGVLIFMQDNIYELHGKFKQWVKLRYKSSIASYATGIIAIPVPDAFSLEDVFYDDSEDEDLNDLGSGSYEWYSEDIFNQDTELEVVKNEATETVGNEINVIEVTETVVPSPTAVTSTSSAPLPITSTNQNEILTTHRQSQKEHNLRSGTSRASSSLEIITIYIVFHFV